MSALSNHLRSIERDLSNDDGTIKEYVLIYRTKEYGLIAASLQNPAGIRVMVKEYLDRLGRWPNHFRTTNKDDGSQDPSADV